MMKADHGDHEGRLRAIERLIQQHDTELDTLRSQSRVLSVVSSFIAGIGAVVYSIWEK